MPDVRRAPSVLYVVYWGALEPLGQSLVLPSVRRLAALGARITLVTYEKAHDFAQTATVDATRESLANAGIAWMPLRYHHRPLAPAKIYDAARGLAAAIVARCRGPIDIVHARTFVGGLIGRAIAPLLGARFVYHNEGFYPDEQVDGGVWARGSSAHRVARALESTLYDRADAIVALSRRARSIIEDRPAVRRRRAPVVVVPSTVDLERFRRRASGSPRTDGGVRLVYIGSIGLRYLFDRLARFAALAHDASPRSSLRVVTLADRALVERTLSEAGLPATAWSVDRLPHERMPAELTMHDAGLFFLTQGLSEHGCSPTKIGEYWACGLPVVTTANVSDTDEIIRTERVGVVVREHSDAAYRVALEELRGLLGDPDLGARCRRAAETHYALGAACERQMMLYRQLLSLAPVELPA